MAEGVETGTPPATPTPSLWSDAIHLFALCGFAIAQPLFDLLGNNPTFFVAHDLDGFGLVVFGLVLLVVPPLALLGVLAVVRAVSAPAARLLRAALAGLLIALTILPPLDRAIGLSTVTWLLLLVALGVAAGFAYDRLRHLRTFVSYLGFAPPLFLVVFLLLSPAHTLVISSDPAAAAVDLQGTRTPVIVLVLDELPLGVLLDDRGQIDETRFPGFARLADTSSWYRNATAASLHTHLAVPAIETGLLPTEAAVPVAAAYPRSLFTLFPRSHELHVSETITRVCPRDLCGDHASAAETDADLTSDLQTVYLRALLPEDTATDWGVASINDRWSGFDQETDQRAAKPGTVGSDLDDFFSKHPFPDDDQLARFDDFLASLRDSSKPGFWFEHLLLPHTPYQLLPDGRFYNGRGNIPGLGADFAAWSDDPELAQVGAQRLLLQTLATDTLVDQLLDRLEQQGMLEKSMLVVTADHGAVFLPSEHHRGFPLDDRNKHHALPVPLFIKYPGQTTGGFEPRDARTFDILPTIVDSLGVQLPSAWKFDGQSLHAARPKDRPLRVVETPGEVVTVERPVDATEMARDLATYLATTNGPHDAFRIGPHGALVGQDVTAIAQGSGAGTVHADSWAAYDALDLDGVLPALFEATVTGVDADQWVAIALNGTIAGVGPTYRINDTLRVVAMLDPSFMRDGANELSVFRIGDDGTLHPISSQR